MRALEPERVGFVERNGARIGYEVFGSGDPTIFFLPTWSIIHSRVWKAQVPYFARHMRVLTYDGVGNGASDRPLDAARYSEEEFAHDALAVMDATGTERAALVAFSIGAQRALLLAAAHPERVSAIAFIGPTVPLAPVHPERAVHPFDEPASTDEGWAKFNRHYWLRDWRGFVEFFFSRVFSEPHSTKQIEDCVGWGLETTPETLLAAHVAYKLDRERSVELCRSLRCPVLVLHGDEDAITPHARGAAVACGPEARS